MIGDGPQSTADEQVILRVAVDELVIRFVPPGDRISMNDRLHWRPLRRLTRLWRQAAHTGALDAFPGRGPAGRCQGPCLVRVAFPVADPGRRRDPHNMAPTVKAIVDGLVDAGVWPDDNERWVTVLDSRFYKPDGPLPCARVLVTLIPRAGGLPQ